MGACDDARKLEITERLAHSTELHATRKGCPADQCGLASVTAGAPGGGSGGRTAQCAVEPARPVGPCPNAVIASAKNSSGKRRVHQMTLPASLVAMPFAARCAACVDVSLTNVTLCPT